MNAGKEKSGFNNIWLGTIIGILLPFLSVVTFYYSSFTGVPLEYFFEHSLQIKVLPKLISVCAIPNLGAFFLFMWRNHLYSARGVILATFLITFFVLALKAFF
jgi:hypothetical protein